MKLQIPQEHKEKFESYVGLSDELKAQIVAEIKSTDVGLLPSSLVKHLSSKIELPEAKLQDIVLILHSLSNAQKGLKLDDEEFADVLNQSFREMNDLEYSVENMVSSVMNFLSQMNTELNSTNKIFELINDNDNVFLDIDFNNDIRPVILENETLSGVIVLHNMKITYRQNEESKQMYFALDTDDLKKLKEQIDKAEKQLEILKLQTELNFIDIK